MVICKLEHVRKDYRMGEVVSPLRDVSLTVQSGDFVAIEGPSGVGKSTLLYVMATMLTADGGTIQFEGTDLSTLSDRALTALRARKIGFLFQDTNLIQALTIRENLVFAQRIGGGKKTDLRQVDEALERFGLTERANFFPHQLSGGQRRRAMAARCLIHTPALILADEPTNDLDEFWASEMMRLLRQESERGAGVVMVTHNSRWAAQASRRLRLVDGVIEEIR